MYNCFQITLIFIFFFADKTESGNADKFLRDIAECWSSVSKEIHCAQSTLEVVISSWQRYKSLISTLEQWIDEANSNLHLPEEQKEIFFQVNYFVTSIRKNIYSLISTNPSFLRI